MLRLLIIAILAYGAYYVVSSMMTSYKNVQKPSAAQVETAVPAYLEGMPPQFQASLDTAQSQGPAAMKRWLDTYRRHIRDPKLGDIELDYAMALMRQNSGQAREIFSEVKARTPANSPLQPRLQRLAKTFE